MLRGIISNSDLLGFDGLLGFLATRICSDFLGGEGMRDLVGVPTDEGIGD